MCIAKNTVDKITEIYTETKKVNSDLIKALSNTDKEIQDLLHFLEFQRFNIVQGYKYAKQLQDLQIKRREIKNELEPLQSIIDVLERNGIQNLNNKISARLQKMQERVYKPRVLKIVNNE